MNIIITVDCEEVGKDRCESVKRILQGWQSMEWISGLDWETVPDRFGYLKFNFDTSSSDVLESIEDLSYAGLFNFELSASEIWVSPACVLGERVALGKVYSGIIMVNTEYSGRHRDETVRKILDNYVEQGFLKYRYKGVSKTGSKMFSVKASGQMLIGLLNDMDTCSAMSVTWNP